MGSKKYLIISSYLNNNQLSNLLYVRITFRMQIAIPGLKFDNEYHCDNVSKYVVKSFIFEQC